MIDKVIEKKLCTNCGTCISACPFSAIVYKRGKNGPRIVVNNKKCTKCGLCLKICPGLGTDFGILNKEIFRNDKKIRHDLNLGYFRDCYLGYSRDESLRFQCSSGGAVTSILVNLLRKRIIDGALVTTMDSEEPLISKPYIAYSKKEIIEARGSKYTPVVLNQCLKEIIKSKRKKFAVVGLPCHIQGIRKFQMVNPILKEKIIVCLGIMCGQGVSLPGTAFILKQLKLEANEVKRIQYRSNGWPGDMTVVNKNGNVNVIPYLEVFKTFTMGFFTPPRCFLCTDLTNELADISFGDAWIPKLIKTKNGTNFIVSRTKIGQELLSKSKRCLVYKPFDPHLLVESKRIRLFCKKSSHKLLARLARPMGFGTLNKHNNTKSRINLLSICVIIFYLISIFSNKYPSLLLRIPFFIWKLPLQMYRKTLGAYKRATLRFLGAS